MLNRKIAPVKFLPTEYNFPVPESIILSNGINLHIFQDSSLEAIKIELYFPNASSIEEPQLGLNLLTSKLLLSGTNNKTSQQISEQFAQLGSFIDVNPSFDYTTLSVYCVRKNSVKTIEFLSNILNNIEFDQKEIDLQRNILINNYQIQQKKNNIVASQQFRNLLFNETPYGTTVSPEALNKITKDSIVEYFKNNWNKLEVFISGNITENIINTFEKTFNNSNYKDNLKHISIPAYTRKDIFIEVSNSVQTSLKVGIPIINKHHVDYPELYFTNYILGGYFGSRLMKNIREDKGLTYGIHSSIINLKHSSYFVISSEVASKHKDSAINEIVKEIHKLSSTYVDNAELEIARNHWLGSFQNDLSSSHSLISKFKSYYLYQLKPDYLSNLYQRISSIESKNISSIAEQYLTVSDMSKSIVGG